MSKFDSASEVESLTWELREASFGRSSKRAMINDLFNGVAPYSEQQMTENNLSVNFNDNTACVAGHGARRQLMAAIQKPNNFFSVKVDRGPVHKRQAYSSSITKHINNPLKKSLPYYEDLRSTIANVVLHGVGPSVWRDRETWRPHARGVEDILIPSNTLLSMENLSLFAVFEPLTAMQLHKLTSGPRVDPAWNMDLVNKLLDQAEEEVMDYGIKASDYYAPEKLAERRKEGSGLYAADSLTTIDTISFYFWNDTDKQAGWNKRIILDADWSHRTEISGRKGISELTAKSKSRIKEKDGETERNSFLYNPGKRKYADKLSQLITFQFGDLSAVAPFRYHSVRSLGQLLYAPCHIQNRLHCHFLDSVFEQLMQYYRVKTLNDYQRALKVDLVNKGYIDESINFVKPEERWKIDQALTEFALQHNERMIAQHSNIYAQRPQETNQGVERKELEIMAQIHSETALVGAALAQAYIYQEAAFQEMARRFGRKNSKDPDIRDFQRNCLRDEVPEDILYNPECWEVTAEKIVGAGNKTLETAIVTQLMQARPAFDPEPQRDILRAFVLGLTDDAAFANRLVPEDQKRISNTQHDAEVTAGALLMGLHVSMQTGINHIEAIESLLKQMVVAVQKVERKGGVPTLDELAGLQNLGQFIGQHIQILSADKSEKQRVKEYSDDLGKLMNLVKGYGQRLQEQMQKAQEQNGQQLDPKDKAKIIGTVINAKTKADLARQSHAQRTAQRQTQFEMGLQQDEQEHQQKLMQQAEEARLDLAKEHLKHRMKAFSE
jgi:hypothetical protein